MQIDPTKVDPVACANLLAWPEIQSLLRTAHADGKYATSRVSPETKTKYQAFYSRRAVGHFLSCEDWWTQIFL